MAKKQNILSGYKTYIGAVACGLVGLALTLGWIDEKTAGIAWSVLGTFTGVSLRQAVKKGEI